MLAPESRESRDAGFFKMMHQRSRPSCPRWRMQTAGSVLAAATRRSSRSRRTNDNLPLREQFRQVQCQDLSTNGIAYFSDVPPAYDRLVVALASAFDVIYLTAAVAHYKQVGPEGQAPCYLIGCRFLGRVQIDR